mmetsp:Transcript_39775/g.105372  ORF Transcript_39775/g.105372 Transcript_39775/m.105372 type:complete len:361 (-) Transcript_39775:648-1730(-)
MLSSDGRSSPSGVVKISTLMISSSTSLSSFSFSSTICLFFQLFSPASAIFLCFMSSVCELFRRDCNFASSAVYDGVSLACPARCFPAMIFFASAQSSAAALSASMVCSAAVFNFSTGVSSTCSMAKGTASSIVFLTAASVCNTMLVTSARSILVFRESVSRLNAATFWDTASTRICNCSSSSAVTSRDASGKFCTSASLAFRKFFVSTAAVSANRAASSQLAIASVASVPVTSLPFKRKGASAWVVAAKSSSASVVLFRPCCNMFCNCNCSICCLSDARKSSSFCFDSLPRSCIAVKSAFNVPCAFCNRAVTKLMALVKLWRTGRTEASAAFRSSSAEEPATMPTTLSTSTSAVPSFRAT